MVVVSNFSTVILIAGGLQTLSLASVGVFYLAIFADNASFDNSVNVKTQVVMPVCDPASMNMGLWIADRSPQ